MVKGRFDRETDILPTLKKATAVMIIGNQVLFGCSSLKSIDIGISHIHEYQGRSAGDYSIRNYRYE